MIVLASTSRPSFRDSRQQWTLVKALGKGSYGRVDALRNNFGDVVAVKSSGFKQEIQKEIKFLIKLKGHKNVVSYIDHVFHVEDNIYDSVMLELGKGNLFDHLRRTILKESTMRHYFHQIVNGLCHIHKRGIVHLDLKSGNIIIGSDGQLKLADFGLSQEFYSPACGTRMRYFRGAIGTYQICPPEAFTKMAYDGRKSDVWALGVLLLEMSYQKYLWAKPETKDSGFRRFFHSESDGESDIVKLARCIMEMDWNRRLSLERIAQNIGGRTLYICLQQLREQKQSSSKWKMARANRHCRLIVRNLPFDTSKDDLQELFSKVGELSEVAIPPCKDKRFPKSCAGFGFVNFVKKSDAANAKEQLNFTQFKGRKIAVDWAVNKDEYVTSVISSKKEEQKSNKKADDESEKVADEESEEAADEENEDLFKEDDDEDENDDEEASDEEDESADDEEDEKAANEDDESEEKQNKKEKKPRKRKEDSAMSEGRVLFLRNLSFGTTKEQLEEVFSDFSEVQLAIVCCFSGSDHSKGSAFVHFKTKQGADDALKELSSEEGITIDGRRINGMVAVPRSDASQFQNNEAGKQKVKDKRNLHLLRASFIRPGTASANEMSQHDVEKRQKLASLAKNKLRNLLMFVSPTRLVIYNVPKNWSDTTLRSKCIVATGNKDAQITECKIWRDFTKLDARGLPESMGYAFVGFAAHEDAFACLRAMNNNPKTFTNDKRPIVEFCIENLQAVRAKERKLAKSKLPKGTVVKKTPVASSNPAVEKAVEKTKAMLSQGGQKSLPKRFGAKIRHRDAKGKAQKKNKASRKRKSTTTSSKPAKKSKLNTKGVTKSLTMM
ncbi:hypothetical protein QR680_011254 [Steinernema hermaphroditum]|uniref:Protein kinase domain-containing protein n=1 Tax=Steinernema hermaphroditum TaxID=289476 RepID=A0AA39MBZ6_9BILA|nr:hypothetical protein QR680_011254 [Steinernema hermaphroditum]